jgi:carbonic anhydrase/acetyltransferase-like protein (isoleucine patch superfamily)
MGAPGRVVREIDEAGVRSLTQAAALYVARWRRFARGLAAQDLLETDAQAFNTEEVR